VLLGHFSPVSLADCFFPKPVMGSVRCESFRAIGFLVPELLPVVQTDPYFFYRKCCVLAKKK